MNHDSDSHGTQPDEPARYPAVVLFVADGKLQIQAGVPMDLAEAWLLQAREMIRRELDNQAMLRALERARPRVVGARGPWPPVA